MPWNAGVRGQPVLELIDSDAPTIRVEAGPGTGKTLGLVRRVLRLLHPHGLNLPGREVLVVAFNRVIAKGLKKEITACLAEAPHDGMPDISTVHALCLQTLGGDLRLLLPHERTAMIYDVLEAFPDLRDRYGTLPAAEQALSDHEAQVAEHLELWQSVLRWLARHDAVLISDLPGLLLDRIRAGDFEGARYQHVIVDEFQDLTRGEQLLFTKLRRREGSFLALGDRRQSIYRFRGNDPEGLARLAELDPAAVVTDLPLLDCRRCPEPIVTAANRIMALHPPPMHPANDDLAAVHVLHWPGTPRAEAVGLAGHIAANIQAHPEDRHLVMVTRRRFGYWLRDAIKADFPDISIDLAFSESLLESWPVREAFLLFCLVTDPDAPTWRAWLGYMTPDDRGRFKAPSRNAGAYLRFLAANDDRIAAEAIEALAREPRTRQRGHGGSNLWDRAQRFLMLQAELEPQDQGDAIAFVDRVFDPDRWILQPDETAQLDMQLVRAKSVQMAEDLLEQDPGSEGRVHLRSIARRLRHMIATREPFEADEEQDLQVTTLWGAKGVTAEHVYILGLCSEALPGERHSAYPGTREDFLEEQRRLFYVSITRCRKSLVLSRPQRIRLGMARQLGLSVRPDAAGRWATLQMCPFLRDIMQILPESEDGTQWEGLGTQAG